MAGKELRGRRSATKVTARISQKLAEKRRMLREEAMRLAKEYETVIYIGGLNHDHDSEGNDRKDMRLPYEQDELIRELFAVKPDMIVVLIGGSPVEMGAWIDQAKTLVWAWYAGKEGEDAPVKELVGFEKVFLKVGEEKQVCVEVETLEPDRSYVIGSSLTDIRL